MNYGFCMGDWYVWNGVDQPESPTRSAFGVNLSRRWASFTDGLSHTLLMSEVKNYQVTIRDCGPSRRSTTRTMCRRPTPIRWRSAPSTRAAAAASFPERAHAVGRDVGPSQRIHDGLAAEPHDARRPD